MRTKTTILLCALVLAVGAGLTAVIFLTEPTAERTGAVRETAMLVDVTGVERGTFRPTIRAVGTVEAAQDVVLSPRVQGEVVGRSPAFVPGGYVRAGEALLQIDPADYENLLQQRRSELSQALADLEIERGRQDVARQDYRLLGDTLVGADQDLVLRQPQLDAAQARVASARAAVRQAELALQRTTVRAPFDAHILRRDVAVGSQVAPGDDLGRLVGVEAYWVAATLPLGTLRWLDVPRSGEGDGPPVRIRDRTGWEEGPAREGRLYRVVGALEEGTRLARVLIVVPDPHGYRTGALDAPPLLLGSFVEALIEAEALEDVVRLDRDHVRDGDTVWLMEDGVLRIRDVDVVFRDAEYAYVAAGLNARDRVVTTNLATVVDGAPLRLEADAPAPAGDETASAAP